MKNRNAKEGALKPRLWTADFLLAFASNMLMYFSFYMLVPVLPFFVIEELGTSESVAGVVLSIYTIATLCVRPFSGYMVDTFARKPLYLICYTIFTIIFAGYLVSFTLTIFIIMRIVHGASFGTNTVVSNTIAIDVMPSERRGEGIGYFGMSSNMAMALGPMLGLLLYSKYSFETAFIVSFLSSLLGLGIASLIKVPQKVTPAHKEVLSLDRFILIKGLPLALSMFVISIGYGVLVNYIGLYSEAIGMAGSAGLFFTLQAVGIIGARFLSAAPINRGAISQIVYIGSLFLIVGYSMFVLFQHSATFYLGALSLGLGYGYIAPAFQTMFINLAEHNRRGTANSTYLTSWDMGIGLGIAFGGVVIELMSFDMLFVFCMVAVIIGALYFRFVGSPFFRRNKLR